MSDKATQKGLRDELGNGFLNLLDSVRHSVEQAAYGQEASGNLEGDFYRWVGPAETAPQPAGLPAVEPAQIEPMEGRPSNLAEREAEAVAYARHLEAGPIGTIEMDNAHDHEWRDFEAWIDGKRDAPAERQMEAEREREGPGQEGPELDR